MGRPPKLVKGTKWGPNLSITKGRWFALEKALGAKLSKERRAAIEKMTQDYLLDAAAETTSRMVDAEEWLHDAVRATRSLDELFNRPVPPRKRNAILAARAHVCVYMDKALRANGQTAKFPLSDMLAMLRGATASAVQECRKLAKQGHFGAWPVWVNGLNLFFQSEGLPVGISKDKGHYFRKADGDYNRAGFVPFLAELQEHLPMDFRAHMPSELLDALAQAAHRARGVPIPRPLSEKLSRNNQPG